MADERQRGYQKKYDKKTKMISVKYVLSDMDDYSRLKNILTKPDSLQMDLLRSLLKIFLLQVVTIVVCIPRRNMKRWNFINMLKYPMKAMKS